MSEGSLYGEVTNAIMCNSDVGTPCGQTDRMTEMIEDIIFPQLRWWVAIHWIHHMKVSFLGLFMKNSVAQKQFRKPKFIIIWQQSERLSHMTYHHAKEKFFHCWAWNLVLNFKWVWTFTLRNFNEINFPQSTVPEFATFRPISKIYSFQVSMCMKVCISSLFEFFRQLSDLADMSPFWLMLNV